MEKNPIITLSGLTVYDSTAKAMAAFRGRINLSSEQHLSKTLRLSIGQTGLSSVHINLNGEEKYLLYVEKHIPHLPTAAHKQL